MLVYNKMKEFIDSNAGEIIRGNQDDKQVIQKIIDLILEVAEGHLTKQEKFGQFDFAINRIGPTF